MSASVVLASLFSASFLQAPDTVRPATLLAELPAATTFELRTTASDTMPVVFVRSTMAPTLHLSALHRELRFALTWLVEGAASYDRMGLVRRYGTDSAEMRRMFYESLRNDTTFVQALLELSGPLVAAQGSVVTDMPVRARVRLTRREAAAIAARFFQVEVESGRRGLWVCAKPQQLRDRLRPEDRAMEAWFYSVVRAEGDSGAREIASGVLRQIPNDRPATQMERQLWDGLAASPALDSLLVSAYRRTAHWAPVVIVE